MVAIGLWFVNSAHFILYIVELSLSQELYGNFNDLTLDWTDGLAAGMLRSAALGTDAVRRWTVFDGPIDAAWIENMNTVRRCHQFFPSFSSQACNA